MFYDEIFAFTIPPSRLREPPPFTQRRLSYRPTVHLKGVTHYTLRARRVKRSTNKTVRTPFVFSAGKTCFMEGTPCGVIFVLRRVDRKDAEGFQLRTFFAEIQITVPKPLPSERK